MNKQSVFSDRQNPWLLDDERERKLPCRLDRQLDLVKDSGDETRSVCSRYESTRRARSHLRDAGFPGLQHR